MGLTYVSSDWGNRVEAKIFSCYGLSAPIRLTRGDCAMSLRAERKNIVPLFEFGCADCGRQFELLISRDLHEQVACPSCASSDVNRLLSRFATQKKSASQDTAAPPSPDVHPAAQMDHCAFNWRSSDE